MFCLFLKTHHRLSLVHRAKLEISGVILDRTISVTPNKNEQVESISLNDNAMSTKQYWVLSYRVSSRHICEYKQTGHGWKKKPALDTCKHYTGAFFFGKITIFKQLFSSHIYLYYQYLSVLI